VTITLPGDILTEAKHLAVDSGMPLSHYVAELVRAKVANRRRYRKAMEQELLRMKTGTAFQLGSIDWTRADLHSR
jgi:DNA anti-recombination protein RmuC